MVYGVNQAGQSAYNNKDICDDELDINLTMVMVTQTHIGEPTTKPS